MRGAYTAHRDVKARHAAAERALDEVEELVAWCIAVRAPRSATRPLAEDLGTGRRVLAGVQAFELLGGIAAAERYVNVAAALERAERIAGRVRDAARSILPRAELAPRVPETVEPRLDEGAYAFANGLLAARVKPDGTIIELAGVDGVNLAGLANGLAIFVDKPAAPDAAHLDPRYERHRRRLRPGRARIEDGGLVVELAGEGAAIAMRIALHAGEPWLRVEIAVRWAANQRVLRVEHRLALHARELRAGEPYGSVVLALDPAPPFEFAAQRWLHAGDGERGVAVLTPDLYGWSAVALRGGGMRLGTSLLRAPKRPDPTADRGEHRFAYALVPTAGATPGALETAWSEYAEPARVRLFSCDDTAVAIVAAKPADDGEGVIVRVRECDGAARAVALRAHGRLRTASPVDGCERPVAGEVRVEDETLHFALPAGALRAFRILP